MRVNSLLLFVFMASLSFATGGCAVDDGRGFGQLSTSLWSRFAALDSNSGRSVGGGWVKTADSFELTFDRLELSLMEVRVQGSSGSAPAAGGVSSGSCTFDPSAPPSGCTLCHGGHCHCDGKLVSYDALKKRACGADDSASSGPVTLVRVPVLARQDLLGSGTRGVLSGCAPSCELSMGSVTRAQVVLSGITAHGSLRDRSIEDRLGGKTLAVRLARSLSGAALSADLAVAESLGRDTPYYLDLALELPLAAGLFDGVLWHKLSAQNDTIIIDASTNTTAGELVTGNLGKTKLTALIKRSDR